MRHLLSAGDVSRDDAITILDTAAELSRVTDRAVKKLPTLRGRTVVNLFFEDSTRTRISFEAAAKRLSADVITFSAKGSSVSKGESLKDTALTLEAMGADAVIVRHGASGAPHRLAHSGWIEGVVINAGDGTHEHPTQALLDAYTLRSHLCDGEGDLGGQRIVIVGDVLHSRVARSNVLLLRTLGADVTVVAPPTLLPVGIESWPCSVSYDLDEALPGADAVMIGSPFASSWTAVTTFSSSRISSKMSRSSGRHASLISAARCTISGACPCSRNRGGRRRPARSCSISATARRRSSTISRS